MRKESAWITYLCRQWEDKKDFRDYVGYVFLGALLTFFIWVGWMVAFVYGG